MSVRRGRLPGLPARAFRHSANGLNHVIDGGLDDVVRQVGTSAFWRHDALAVDGGGIKRVYVTEQRRPRFLVAVGRRVEKTGLMTGRADGVVHLFRVGFSTRPTGRLFVRRISRRCHRGSLRLIRNAADVDFPDRLQTLFDDMFHRQILLFGLVGDHSRDHQDYDADPDQYDQYGGKLIDKLLVIHLYLGIWIIRENGLIIHHCPLHSSPAPDSDINYCVDSRAPVAQLDRASPSGGEGRRFESCQARLFPHGSPWRRCAVRVAHAGVIRRAGIQARVVFCRCVYNIFHAVDSGKLPCRYMNHLPTLRQLQLLLSLKKHRHFGKAADECCITQSAFSIAFRKFEDTLGVSLAERSNRTVILTPLGMEAAKLAEKVLAEARDMAAILASKNKPLAGDLRLGVIPTIAPFLLPRVLKRLSRKYPDLNLLIKEGQTLSIYRDLTHGDLDLILVALPFDFKNVDTLTLFRDHFLLAYRKGTALLNPNRYSETELPDSSILLLEDGHCLRKHTLSACKLERTSKISPYTTSSLYTLVQMVDNDLGITFVPQLAVEGGLLARTNIEVKAMKGKAYREIGFIWRKGSPRSEEFRLFAEPFRKFAPAGVSAKGSLSSRSS